VEFAEITGELNEAGYGIIAFSSDSPAEALEIRERLELPYKVYSDPECETIKALGIFHDDEPKGRQIARPTIYILDQDRTILYRYVGEGSRDRPETATIPALVQSL
jgi:peroxiredoxin